MTKVFIDGSAGTTGLRIYDRLTGRKDIELIILSDEFRKDPAKRKEALNEADIAFLCLPDDAAIEAVELAEGADTVIIDTSTAHRTSEQFIYGFPEIVGNSMIQNSKRIANPGCHASGFVALIYPLVKAGLISGDEKLTCFSLTGYSGGGKKMIADYESADRSELLKGPRQYGLTQQHKHLKEMKRVCGLTYNPLFSPIVADFYSGMEVSVPIFADSVKGSIENIKEVYKEFYQGPMVHFDEEADEAGFLSAATFSMRDDMQICVHGNDERIILTSRFDNLGKGASGSAIQNMNIVLGLDETTGLVTGGK
ncbi:MAG: N-acetyl-gamma-glutamyl-phosphate reductase [Lachnospiraceae bacterium]|nr:N-acetyl-gamma-glutamyl-phosphate reductase [Lachnospiraceae bacterium]MBR6349125.1 N-acetyl-gamma-glutamyl-phosphate reductase [Lachnospiraceae bacterium]